MQRPDRHNEIELNLLKGGELHYLLGGQQVTIKAGQLAVFWAAIPHQIIRSLDRTEYFVATIPLAWFLQCRFPEPFSRAILHGHILFDPESALTRGDLEMFGRWVSEVREPSPAHRRLVLLEMEARLLRFALSHPAPPRPAGRGRPLAVSPQAHGLSRVEQMASFIAQNYTRKLTAGEISGAVQLHANYAMALFKKAFGLSLVAYITQHRVTHAQRLLATTDEKIVEVALASGFNSISRFNEAFKRTCNCSPRQYRDHHRLTAPR
jgi:AraC-like DNA-binding protein